jgi:hypothetical protein
MISKGDRFRPGLRTLALGLNGVFWIYFWGYFAFASQPVEKAFYMDHPLDPYIFWGHAIGMGMNPLILPFMKAMVCVELPSFFLATFLQNLFTGEPAGRLLAGVLGYFGDKLFPDYPNQSAGFFFLEYQSMATDFWPQCFCRSFSGTSSRGWSGNSGTNGRWSSS